MYNNKDKLTPEQEAKNKRDQKVMEEISFWLALITVIGIGIFLRWI